MQKICALILLYALVSNCEGLPQSKWIRPTRNSQGQLIRERRQFPFGEWVPLNQACPTCRPFADPLDSGLRADSIGLTPPKPPTVTRQIHGEGNFFSQDESSILSVPPPPPSSAITRHAVPNSNGNFQNLQFTGFTQNFNNPLPTQQIFPQAQQIQFLPQSFLPNQPLLVSGNQQQILPVINAQNAVFGQTNQGKEQITNGKTPKFSSDFKTQNIVLEQNKRPAVQQSAAQFSSKPTPFTLPQQQQQSFGVQQSFRGQQQQQNFGDSILTPPPAPNNGSQNIVIPGLDKEEIQLLYVPVETLRQRGTLQEQQLLTQQQNIQFQNKPNQSQRQVTVAPTQQTTTSGPKGHFVTQNGNQGQTLSTFRVTPQPFSTAPTPSPLILQQHSFQQTPQPFVSATPATPTLQSFVTPSSVSQKFSPFTPETTLPHLSTISSTLQFTQSDLEFPTTPNSILNQESFQGQTLNGKSQFSAFKNTGGFQSIQQQQQFQQQRPISPQSVSQQGLSQKGSVFLQGQQKQLEIQNQIPNQQQLALQKEQEQQRLLQQQKEKELQEQLLLKQRQQKELEAQRLLQQQKQKELEEQRYLQQQRQKELEEQQRIQLQRQKELEEQLLLQQQRQKELEHQRLLQQQKEKELENQRRLQLQKQKELEEKRRLQQIRQKEEEQRLFRIQQQQKELEEQRLLRLKQEQQQQKELEEQQRLYRLQQQQKELEEQRLFRQRQEEQQRLIQQRQKQEKKQQQVPFFEQQPQFPQQQFKQSNRQTLPVNDKLNSISQLEKETGPDNNPSLVPHQPPLSVFYRGQGGSEPSVIDVLRELRSSNTVTVLDQYFEKMPKVFVGPAGLIPPTGYNKFELPYLSNLETNRIERKIDRLPFFVAPLNFVPPPGYAKIPFPAPHVGSVVVSSESNPAMKSAERENGLGSADENASGGFPVVGPELPGLINSLKTETATTTGRPVTISSTSLPQTTAQLRNRRPNSSLYKTQNRKNISKTRVQTTSKPEEEVTQPIQKIEPTKEPETGIRKPFNRFLHRRRQQTKTTTEASVKIEDGKSLENRQHYSVEVLHNQRNTNQGPAQQENSETFQDQKRIQFGSIDRTTPNGHALFEVSPTPGFLPTGEAAGSEQQHRQGGSEYSEVNLQTFEDGPLPTGSAKTITQELYRPNAIKTTGQHRLSVVSSKTFPKQENSDKFHVSSFEDQGAGFEGSGVNPTLSSSAGAVSADVQLVNVGSTLSAGFEQHSAPQATSEKYFATETPKPETPFTPGSVSTTGHQQTVGFGGSDEQYTSAFAEISKHHHIPTEPSTTEVQPSPQISVNLRAPFSKEYSQEHGAQDFSIQGEGKTSQNTDYTKSKFLPTGTSNEQYLTGFAAASKNQEGPDFAEVARSSTVAPTTSGAVQQQYSTGFTIGAQEHGRNSEEERRPSFVSLQDVPSTPQTQPQFYQSTTDTQAQFYQSTPLPQQQYSASTQEPQQQYSANTQEPRPQYSANTQEPQPQYSANTQEPRPQYTLNTPETQSQYSQNAPGPQFQYNQNKQEYQSQYNQNSQQSQPQFSQIPTRSRFQFNQNKPESQYSQNSLGARTHFTQNTPEAEYQINQNLSGFRFQYKQNKQESQPQYNQNAQGSQLQYNQNTQGSRPQYNQSAQGSQIQFNQNSQGAQIQQKQNFPVTTQFYQNAPGAQFYQNSPEAQSQFYQNGQEGQSQYVSPPTAAPTQEQSLLTETKESGEHSKDVEQSYPAVTPEVVAEVSETPSTPSYHLEEVSQDAVQINDEKPEKSTTEGQDENLSSGHRLSLPNPSIVRVRTRVRGKPRGQVNFAASQSTTPAPLIRSRGESKYTENAEPEYSTKAAYQPVKTSKFNQFRGLKKPVRTTTTTTEASTMEHAQKVNVYTVRPQRRPSNPSTVSTKRIRRPTTPVATAETATESFGISTPGAYSDDSAFPPSSVSNDVYYDHTSFSPIRQKFRKHFGAAEHKSDLVGPTAFPSIAHHQPTASQDEYSNEQVNIVSDLQPVQQVPQVTHVTLDNSERYPEWNPSDSGVDVSGIVLTTTRTTSQEEYQQQEEEEPKKSLDSKKAFDPDLEKKNGRRRVRVRVHKRPHENFEFAESQNLRTVANVLVPPTSTYKPNDENSFHQLAKNSDFSFGGQKLFGHRSREYFRKRLNLTQPETDLTTPATEITGESERSSVGVEVPGKIGVKIFRKIHKSQTEDSTPGVEAEGSESIEGGKVLRTKHRGYVRKVIKHKNVVTKEHDVELDHQEGEEGGEERHVESLPRHHLREGFNQTGRINGTRHRTIVRYVKKNKVRPHEIEAQQEEPQTHGEETGSNQPTESVTATTPVQLSADAKKSNIEYGSSEQPPVKQTEEVTGERKYTQKLYSARQNSQEQQIEKETEQTKPTGSTEQAQQAEPPQQTQKLETENEEKTSRTEQPETKVVQSTQESEAEETLEAEEEDASESAQTKESTPEAPQTEGTTPIATQRPKFFRPGFQRPQYTGFPRSREQTTATTERVTEFQEKRDGPIRKYGKTGFGTAARGDEVRKGNDFQSEQVKNKNLHTLEVRKYIRTKTREGAFSQFTKNRYHTSEKTESVVTTEGGEREEIENEEYVTPKTESTSTESKPQTTQTFVPQTSYSGADGRETTKINEEELHATTTEITENSTEDNVEEEEDEDETGTTFVTEATTAAKTEAPTTILETTSKTFSSPSIGLSADFAGSSAESTDGSVTSNVGTTGFSVGSSFESTDSAVSVDASSVSSAESSKSTVGSPISSSGSFGSSDGSITSSEGLRGSSHSSTASSSGLTGSSHSSIVTSSGLTGSSYTSKGSSAGLRSSSFSSTGSSTGLKSSVASSTGSVDSSITSTDSSDDYTHSSGSSIGSSSAGSIGLTLGSSTSSVGSSVSSTGSTDEYPGSSTRTSGSSVSSFGSSNEYLGSSGSSGSISSSVSSTGSSIGSSSGSIGSSISFTQSSGSSEGSTDSDIGFTGSFIESTGASVTSDTAENFTESKTEEGTTEKVSVSFTEIQPDLYRFSKSSFSFDEAGQFTGTKNRAHVRNITADIIESTASFSAPGVEKRIVPLTNEDVVPTTEQPRTEVTRNDKTEEEDDITDVSIKDSTESTPEVKEAGTTTVSDAVTKAKIAKMVKTSTTTKISHETEICYRGKCIRTRSDNPDDDLKLLVDSAHIMKIEKAKT